MTLTPASELSPLVACSVGGKFAVTAEKRRHFEGNLLRLRS